MPGPGPDNACEGCGRTIARDNTLCNACSGSASSASVGDRKRAEWARVAAERDAAWEPGEAHTGPVVDHETCESCGRTISRDQTLCNACGRSGGDAVGDRKRAEWARAAVERDAAWHRRHSPANRAARRRRRIRYLVLAGAALATSSAVLAVVLYGANPTPPDPPAARIEQATTFEQAIAIARPALVDTTDDLGEGAQLLVIYAAAKLRWSEVDVPAETTIRHAETDLEGARGKRLCATGEIRQITRRVLGGRKLHVGRLRPTGAHEVAFVAVGTMGALAERSTGRLCGAVIGTSGAVISILGMFDLAENRLPLVEQE